MKLQSVEDNDFKNNLEGKNILSTKEHRLIAKMEDKT